MSKPTLAMVCTQNWHNAISLLPFIALLAVNGCTEMNMTRKQETARFQAAADDGELFTIVEITNQTGFTPLATGVTKWADSLKEYRVPGSGAANQISQTEYEIVSSGKIVKRV